MGVIQRFKQTITDSPDEQAVTFRCRVCGDTFRPRTEDVDQVWCPQCGSNEVREVSPDAGR